MQDYRQLKVWQQAHELVLDVYSSTASFPRDELFGLTSQIRRCSVSIPSNIAEGCGRDSRTELARFLQIAMGSASELEYQLLLSKDLGFLTTPDHERLASSVGDVKRMLIGLTATVRRAQAASR